MLIKGVKSPRKNKLFFGEFCLTSSSLKFSSVQFSSYQFRSDQFSSVQSSPVQFSSVQCNAMHYNMIQCRQLSSVQQQCILSCAVQCCILLFAAAVCTIYFDPPHKTVWFLTELNQNRRRGRGAERKGEGGKVIIGRNVMFTMNCDRL